MFLASSIVKALRDNNSLVVYGLDLVACPVTSCTETSDDCDKGQNELCVKKIDVVYEHDGHNKVIVLMFRYQLKNYDREGFIRIGDLALNILIDRGIIHKADLAVA